VSAQRNGEPQHRILVVDDEPSIVDAVATALRYEGYAVDEATSGRQALAAVAKEEPDLVVLDWISESSMRTSAPRSAASGSR
jgi:two-component system OmpR family response regulator